MDEEKIRAMIARRTVDVPLAVAERFLAQMREAFVGVRLLVSCSACGQVHEAVAMLGVN